MIESIHYRWRECMKFKWLGIVILILICSQLCLAWNKPGHMVSGAIAYKDLVATNPEVAGKVIGLLKKHPYYELKWKSAINGQIDAEMLLCALAARWPDDIRGTNEHCELCHYINYPYKPSNQPSSVVVREPEPNSIVSALQENVALLRSNVSDEEKAKALCWVFHLLGDIHQPLHTSALFTTIFPNGDRGGTRFYVRVTDTSSTISLHQFWDDLILGSDRFQAIRNTISDLRSRSEFERSRLTELAVRDFEKWAKTESFQIAIKDVYLEGDLDGSSDSRDGSVLPDDYGQRAKAIAQRRIMLAGLRLSDLLGGLFTSGISNIQPFNLETFRPFDARLRVNSVRFTTGDFEGCPPEGNGGDPDLNRLKNRDVAPTTLVPRTIREIINNQPLTASEQARSLKRENWPIEALEEIQDWENEAVVVEGYLIAIKKEGREGCNCGSAQPVLKYADYHLWLAESPNHTKAKSIVAELSPRLSRTYPNLNQATINRLITQRAKVRVSGWVMWDQEHGDQVGRSRATLWEIHPIHKIEVFSNGEWKNLN